MIPNFSFLFFVICSNAWGRCRSAVLPRFFQIEKHALRVAQRSALGLHATRLDCTRHDDIIADALLVDNARLNDLFSVIAFGIEGPNNVCVCPFWILPKVRLHQNHFDPNIGAHHQHVQP